MKSDRSLPSNLQPLSSNEISFSLNPQHLEARLEHCRKLIPYSKNAPIGNHYFSGRYTTYNKDDFPIQTKTIGKSMKALPRIHQESTTISFPSSLTITTSMYSPIAAEGRVWRVEVIIRISRWPNYTY